MRRSRNLDWDGLLNARDLGGHPTEDGAETRWGSVVRTDSVHLLTEEGWRDVVGYGVRTVVDLRLDDEREADPPAELPVDIVHVPLLEQDGALFAEAESAGSSAPDVATGTRDVYLLFLERFHRNAAAAVRAVAQAPAGGVVVHCMGGKDRTGLVTALLLRLAGVGIDEIAADYAVSEKRLQPRHDAWFAEVTDEEELARLRRIAATPEASMKGVLEELERRYGSIAGYLRAGGATDEELERARARLRD